MSVARTEFLARHLALNNEVWGIARFGEAGDRSIENYKPATGGDPGRDLSPRDELEAAGITTRAVDLGVADFSE